MKLKLAGLLVFSQAASAVTAIDKTNYRQHLCDDNLFKPLPIAFEGAFDNSMAAQSGRQDIKNDFINYCYFRSKYETEVERKKHGLDMYPQSCSGDTDPKHYMTKGACVEKTGVDYAKACEKAKQDKADPSKQRAWNEAVTSFESCNNSRRR